MKIKVTDKILQYDGTPILDIDQKPMTWRKIFFYVLNISYPTEQGLPQQQFIPEEKEKAFAITTKIYISDEVELSTEECNFILEQIKKKESPLILGRAKELFKIS